MGMMMYAVKLSDRKSSVEFMSVVGLSMDIVTLVKGSRLHWYGHVSRRNKGFGITRVLDFEAEGVTGRDRLRLVWREQAEKERVKAGL